MKKLKLTINGEVNTFDLPENGEYKCEVEESYVPKVGDCVKFECDKNFFYWLKVKKVLKTSIEFSLTVGDDLTVSKHDFFAMNKYRIFTQITTEELKAKYAEAGYDWDYESDTIKPLKWMPKDGDEVWSLGSFLNPVINIFEEDSTFIQLKLKKGLLFKTEAECQKFANHCWEYLKK